MSTCKLISSRATTIEKGRYVRALYSFTDKTYETYDVLPFILVFGFIDNLQAARTAFSLKGLANMCADINDMPYIVKPEEQKLIEQSLFWEKIKN